MYNDPVVPDVGAELDAPEPPKPLEGVIPVLPPLLGFVVPMPPPLPEITLLLDG